MQAQHSTAQHSVKVKVKVKVKPLVMMENVSLRPGAGGLGGLSLGSPFAGLALGAKGKTKTKGKQSREGGGGGGGGLASHPLSPQGQMGKGAKGSGKSKTTALNILSSSSLSGLTTTEKSGPKVTYDREEILLYAEHYTTLPADLEGTTFEIMLQPGDEAGGAWRDQKGKEATATTTTATAASQNGNDKSNSANWSKDKKDKGGKGDKKGAGKKNNAAAAAGAGANAAGGASPKIVKAADAWKPSVAQSDTEKALRRVRAILNKLTPENFERLFSQLVECVTSEDILSGSITMLFEKAVAEPMFCSLNAELCLRLSKELPNFRKTLLNTCQEEFEGSLMGLNQEDTEEKEDENSKAKRRMLGNVKLIGHLFRRKVINQKIVHLCVQCLLADVDVHENCIECACDMLSLTAKQLGETPQAVPLVEGYFKKLGELSAKPQLSSRVRFIIKDVQELRRAKWIPRKEAVTAKTISEIHAEAQAELGIAVVPDSLAKTFAPLSGMRTKADEVQDLLPALRGGDSGWNTGKGHSDTNIFDGSKYSALVGEAPPLPSKEELKAADAAPASTSAPAGTPEELEKRTKSLLTEYVSSADVGEALLCVKELNSPEFMPKVVELIISNLLDNAKPTERKLLIKLLVALKKDMSESDLAKGLRSHTDMLEDLAIDVPLAPQLLAEAVAAVGDVSLLEELLSKMEVEDCEVKEKFEKLVKGLL